VPSVPFPKEESISREMVEIEMEKAE